jgi:hypothetical protein
VAGTFAALAQRLTNVDEGRLDRHAPWAFVGIGVAMIVVAAFDYLPTSVAVAFVVLGAALVAVGGLAARIEGTIKVGLQGFEMALRARQAIAEVQQQVEASGTEEAKRIGATLEQIDQDLDDWFEAYKRHLARHPVSSPFERAALMKEYWMRAARRSEPESGEPSEPGE